MIAVDTSALMAIIQAEPHHELCEQALAAAIRPKISAVTVAEALVVGLRRGIADEMTALIDGLDFEIVQVTAACSRRIADIYKRWGKGAHPAALNFGDCFAYDIAATHGCPLLYVGHDFSKTDIPSAIEPV